MFELYNGAYFCMLLCSFCICSCSCIFVSVCISEFVVCILCLNCICCLRFVHRVSYHTCFACSFLSIVANFCLYTRCLYILIVMFFVFVLNFKHALYVDGVDNLNFIFLNRKPQVFQMNRFMTSLYMSCLPHFIFMTCLSRPVYDLFILSLYVLGLTDLSVTVNCCFWLHTR